MLRKSKASPKAKSGSKLKPDLPDYEDRPIRASKKKPSFMDNVFDKYIKDYIVVIMIAAVFFILKLYSTYQDSVETSIYDFTVKNIYGNDVDLSIYRGQVVLIVNVASQCTYTESNLEILPYVNKLKIKGKPIRILAFPCDQFGNQESSIPSDILKFSKAKNQAFDLFAKVEVTGKNVHPLFKFLQNDFGDIKWNFYKFIIDENGVPVRKFSSEADFYKISSALQDLFHVDDM